ncbi:MAG TPA: hypothetical protein VFC04_01585 [Actinomycetota bacterium]|jgi:hypothetical protein|nr:hypothetical protein [Actinomycetota bacterium]
MPASHPVGLDWAYNPGTDTGAPNQAAPADTPALRAGEARALANATGLREVARAVRAVLLGTALGLVIVSLSRARGAAR